MAIFDAYYHPLHGIKVVKRGLLSSSTHKMNKKGFHQIGTTEAFSQQEALKKVESVHYQTEPIPYKKVHTKEQADKVTISGEAFVQEVMCVERERIEELARLFILYNTEDFTEEQHVDCVIFSYVIEWACLTLSNIAKHDLKLLMHHFTNITSPSVLTSDDSTSTQFSAEIFLNGIKLYESALDENAGHIHSIAMKLGLIFLEISELGQYIKKENGVVEFIDVLSDKMQSRIKQNRHLISTFNLEFNPSGDSVIGEGSKIEYESEPGLKVHVMESGTRVCKAYDIAESTYAYMKAVNKIISSFMSKNHQLITSNRELEIVAFTFNLYRIGFIRSKFPINDKKIIVTKLLAYTFSNCNLKENLAITSEFISKRCELYEQAISNTKSIHDYGPPLLAQLIAACRIEASSITHDFRDMADMITEIIKTAIARNNKLADDCQIIDD